MSRVAVILIIGVFLRHDAANWLASGSRLSPAAWHYILGGAWEVMLCALLLWVVYGYRWSVWRGIASTALVIGMLEGMQISACRLAVDDIRAVPVGMNLCDFRLGLPVGAVMTSLYLIMLAWQVGRAIRERSARHC